jgi:hypothetical protein
MLRRGEQHRHSTQVDHLSGHLVQRVVHLAQFVSIQHSAPSKSSMSISERKKEIRRRRKRREKLTKLKTRLGKATKSEQVEIARKVRDMTPGAEVVIANWGLAAVDR